MTAKRKRLTAKTKFNIFLNTRAKDAPVGKFLREYGLHLADLSVELMLLKKNAI